MVKKKRGGDIDLHSLLPKTPLNPPGFRYLGPNNPLEKQVDEHGIPHKGQEPTSALDAIALKHDLLYDRAERMAKPRANGEPGINKDDVLRMKHEADKIFVEEAKQAPKENLYQRIMNWIARM